MKRKTVALYDPYLDVLGGGEKHILSILKVLTEEDYSPTLFWNENVSEKISKQLDLHFSSLNFKPNIFKQPISVFQKYRRLSDYDMFIYVTDGSYFLSGAKKNVIFGMVPDKKLYTMTLMNKLKTFNSQFITNSQFTKKNLEQWGVPSDYIYPYIEDNLINIDTTKLQKQPIILSVGRFFKHLHAKRQDKMISLFKKLKQENKLFKDFRLVLAGGLKKEDEFYFEELKELIGNDPSIQLLPNVTYNEKVELYKKSMIYWHFAGYEIDEKEHPEFTEHLGITPLEAMSAGCVAFCYRAGGLKEIIHDNMTGYLFDSYQELNTKMTVFLSEKQDLKTIQSNAKQFIKETFSYEVFKERVKEVILK